ncbi:Ribulose bisphosphate carboxylase large chain [Pseudogymnoascus australis]
MAQIAQLEHKYSVAHTAIAIPSIVLSPIPSYNRESNNFRLSTQHSTLNKPADLLTDDNLPSDPFILRSCTVVHPIRPPHHHPNELVTGIVHRFHAVFLLGTYPPGGAAAISSTTFTIPSSSSTRRPANIPLRNLPSAATRSQEQFQSASLLSDDEKQSGFSASPRSESAGSEFSDWSDTGDLGEQGTGEDDPLRRQLGEFDNNTGRHTGRRNRGDRRVRYRLDAEHEDKKHHRGFVKEDIEIPTPPPRKISRAEQALATMMAGGERQMHGLTGKPLSCPVSSRRFLSICLPYILSADEFHRGPIFLDYFHKPNAAEIGTMVAILEVGAFISSLVVGRLGDIIGRRRTILYGSLIFVSSPNPMWNSIHVEVMAWIKDLLRPYTFQTLIYSANTNGCNSSWLLDNDHDEEGMVVIANLYGEGDIHNDKAREEFREIKMNVLIQRQEGERSYLEMFKRYRARVFIAMSAQALAQLNGINVISYYAPLVFISAGWVGRQAILMTGINGITYFLSTIPPWYLVDRLGRRPILLSGAIMMAISLSAIAYFLHLDIKATPTLVVVFVMIYNAAFGFSWGPIPWLYPPEILPLSIRSKGASLSTATNWFFNFIVGEITPILQETIGWRLYLMHAFFCVTSFVVVYFIYPETRGVRLEDMNLLFGDATSAMPTPATRAETGSLMGRGSPVPSMDLRRGVGTTSVENGLGSSMAIPGLDIDPPTVDIRDGIPRYSVDRSRGEGVGGWISRMVGGAANGGSSSRGGANSKYKPLDQDEE